MLAHTIKGDVDPKDEKASLTTRQFYDFGQRIPLKTIAMKAWSEELLKSFKAGGRHLSAMMPAGTTINPQWPAPAEISRDGRGCDGADA